MCNGRDCPRRMDCYRYIAIPDKLQSYGYFDDVCNEKTEYMYFIKATDYEKRFYEQNRKTSTTM